MLLENVAGFFALYSGIEILEHFSQTTSLNPDTYIFFAKGIKKDEIKI